MSAICYVYLAICLSVVCSGCRKEAESIYSEEHVRSVVAPGASRETIERAFGRPLTTMVTGSGETVAIYRLPDTAPVAFRDKFTGFQVWYRENRVEKWFSVYSDQSVLGSSDDGTVTQSQTNQTAGIEPDGISFYVVSEAILEGGTYVHNPVLPDGGYIAATPDVTFRSLESVVEAHLAVGTGANQELPMLVITLSESDGQTLRDFTETHVGKRVLICLGRRFLAAPYILSPINNGQLSVSFRDSHERDEAVRKLRMLVRKP